MLNSEADDRLISPIDGEGDRSSSHDNLLEVFASSLQSGRLDERTRSTWQTVDASDSWTRKLRCVEFLARAWPAPAATGSVHTPEGSQLGRFIRQRELGQGATSVVFLALDPALKRLNSLARSWDRQ